MQRLGVVEVDPERLLLAGRQSRCPDTLQLRDVSGEAGKRLSSQIAIAHPVETVGAGNDMGAQDRLILGMVRRRDRPANQRRRGEESGEAGYHGTAGKPAVPIIWCCVLVHVWAYVGQKRGGVRALTAN